MARPPRAILWYARAALPGRTKSGKALPSKGGTGSKLKTPRRRFKENPRLRSTAAKCGSPDCTATTVSEKSPVSPGTKMPAAKQKKKKQTTTKKKKKKKKQKKNK